MTNPLPTQEPSMAPIIPEVKLILADETVQSALQRVAFEAVNVAACRFPGQKPHPALAEFEAKYESAVGSLMAAVVRSQIYRGQHTAQHTAQHAATLAEVRSQWCARGTTGPESFINWLDRQMKEAGL